MIYHIYWGTSGNSGLYIDEIYQSLKNEGFKQQVFVSHYYPFNYGKKIFFKYGDIGNSKFKGVVRKLVQLLELGIAYIKIFLAVIIDRPKIINYSHVGQSYFFIYFFLYIIKKISPSKLVITCHDVNPHHLIRGEMKYRQLIFDIADYLLVHNDNSIDELNDNFNFDKDKIINHPFPLMDIPKMESSAAFFDKKDFLFIGHLRKDKGIEFLLDSWKFFHEKFPYATLRVCGKKTENVFFDAEELSNYNIEFNLEYISDEDYFFYIKSTRYVILPYINGTNSGIVSTVLSLEADVITSDIPMFKANPLINLDDMFKSNNKDSLIDVLELKFLNQKSSSSTERLNKYRNEFNSKVVDVYSKLLN